MRRVVVTGLGITSPLGTGIEKNWDALMHGRSGVGPITRFDTADFPVKIAAEVTDFPAEEFFDRKEARKMDLFIHYALGAAAMALADSGLEINDDNAERVGVVVGSGMGGLPAIEKYQEAMSKGGYRKVSPFFIPMTIINLAGGQISIKCGAKGPNIAPVSACATGTHSIGDAYRMIQRSDADAVIAGGTEATICPLAMSGFAVMKALSTRNDDPQAASRPFEKNRDGFVMGEGGGCLIFEEYEHAKKRGAKIYAEIVGGGMSGDAYHLTASHPEGRGAINAMKMALSDANLKPEDIDYVNVHGTSTPVGDIPETRALKTVFGEHAYKLNISSTKSMTGHLLGAAGSVEAIACILAMKSQTVPPTINHRENDPEIDEKLNLTLHKAQKREIRAALSNTFGFGGHNASVIFKPFTD